MSSRLVHATLRLRPSSVAPTVIPNRIRGVAIALAAVLLVGVAPVAARAAAAPGALCNTPSATPDCVGATLLQSDTNKIHYDVLAGTTVTSKIVGATDLTGTESCTGGSAGTIDVFVKTSFFGNQVVCGTLSGCPGNHCTVTFTYASDATCSCNTSIIAYGAAGNNSNNDIIVDGVLDGNGNQGAGYAYVDQQGNVITTCSGNDRHAC